MIARRRVAVAITLIATLVAASCDAPTVVRPEPAFDPTQLSNGLVYRWPSGSKLSIWVESDESEESSLLVAVSRAVLSWNEVPEFGEYFLQRSASLEDADIVIYDRRVSNPVVPAGCAYDPRGSGSTWFCLENGVAQPLISAMALPTRATVLITVDRGAVASQEAYDAVVTHEIGHALGIGGHSPETDDVMYGAPTNAIPTGRDRQTLHYVLGQRPDATLR